MKNTDDLFNNFVAHGARNLIDSTDDKNTAAQTRLMLTLLGILAFVGIEAVKVVFRKNFGRKGISMVRIVLCSLIFAFIAASAFNTWSEGQTGDMDEAGNHASFLAVTVFYSILAFFVLVKGIIEKVKAVRSTTVNPYYRGESSLLNFLVKEGWSQNRVQNLAEPLLALGMGVFLASVNLMWGLPLMFCAASVWCYALVEVLFGSSHVTETLQEKGHKQGQNNEFSQINY